MHSTPASGRIKCDINPAPDPIVCQLPHMPQQTSFRPDGKSCTSCPERMFRGLASFDDHKAEIVCLLNEHSPIIKDCLTDFLCIGIFCARNSELHVFLAKGSKGI